MSEKNTTDLDEQERYPSTNIHIERPFNEHMPEDRNIVADERFKTIRCFDFVFGTSTYFELSVNTDQTMNLKGKECLPLKIQPDSEPNTMSMSFIDTGDPVFLTYVNEYNEVKVFCPELTEPIGKIETKQTLNQSGIFSLTTDESFTIRLYVDREAMHIADLHGNVVANAEIVDLRRYTFKVQNGLSQPARIMLLVSFVFWAKEVLRVKEDLNQHPISINQQPVPINQQPVQINQQPLPVNQQPLPIILQPTYITQSQSQSKSSGVKGCSICCSIILIFYIMIRLIRAFNSSNNY